MDLQLLLLDRLPALTSLSGIHEHACASLRELVVLNCDALTSLWDHALLGHLESLKLNGTPRHAVGSTRRCRTVCERVAAVGQWVRRYCCQAQTRALHHL